MQAGFNRAFNVILTGGIGSGKSAVSDLFSKLDVPIIDTDVIARLVVEPKSKGLGDIVLAFGESILNKDGALNRSALRELVFHDDEKLQRLNSITHPLIHSEVLKQLSQHHNSNYTITVVPLFDKHVTQFPFERVLLVDVSIDTQMQRAAHRDHCNPEQILKIIRTQTPRETRIEQADDIIDNNGEQSELCEHVNELHQQYNQLARRWASERI